MEIDTMIQMLTDLKTRAVMNNCKTDVKIKVKDEDIFICCPCNYRECADEVLALRKDKYSIEFLTPFKQIIE